MLASVLATVPLLAWSGDYQMMGFVSDTIGVSSSRICVGAPSSHRPSDYGCPSYAPSLTTAGDVSITGNVSANKFIGDGSGLTGVTASSADRITSGTTSFVVISNTGYISLTQGATNTGWFSPYTGLVTLGVSSTGGISGTTGYYSGKVGVGTSNPTMALEISGSQKLSGSIWAQSGNVNSNAFRHGTTGGSILIQNTQNFSVAATSVAMLSGSTYSNSTGTMVGVSIIPVYNQSGAAAATDLLINRTETAVGSGSQRLFDAQVGGASKFAVLSSGNVGIGTTAPSATLDVSGTIKIAGTGAEVCDSQHYNMIRVNPATGAVEICRQ